MKTLVIAEKPSVAQDIVRALTPVAGKFEKHDEHFENDLYVVTSAVGHLLEIQAPEEFDVKRGKWSFAHLPVIPPYFDLKPVDKTKTRLNAVVRQAKRKDVGSLVNACDAGREGELIFRLIEQYAGGAKPLGKPVKRLWLQSMTPQAIRDGFESLRTEQQMRGLADAARSRSEADWLVGINGTRAMTAFNSRDGGFFLTTVGRVQTPTLAVMVEREEQIRKFISRDYWEIHATFLAEAGEYPAKWFDPKWKKDAEDGEKRADRVWTQREAQAIADAVRGKAATVTEESQAHLAGQPAPVRPDQPAARGQRQVRLQCQDHAGAGAKSLRAAQGLDLPADRFARAARGLPAGGQADLRHAGRQRHAASGAPCAHRARQQLYQAQQTHLRQQQGERPLRHHPHAAGAQRPERCRAEAL